jgi:polysaccharide export outer membrane protein
MRTAILSALLATTLGFYLAAQTAQQPPQQQTPPQEAKPDTKKKPDAPPASLSPMIPVTNPADPGEKSATDPTHMAGPSGTVGAVGAKPAPVDTKSYVIGSDDELSIIVFENQGFNVPLESVRPDGKITMPLIGELQAAGKTPEQLKAEITNVLSTNYMNLPPHVSVVVVRVLSKNYYINGEVLKPGKYPLTVPTTVMQALVNAGGFKDFAKTSKIRIQRGTTSFKFNYNEVSKGKKLEQNIVLQPDDQIYVN